MGGAPQANRQNYFQQLGNKEPTAAFVAGGSGTDQALDVAAGSSASMMEDLFVTAGVFHGDAEWPVVGDRINEWSAKSGGYDGFVWKYYRVGL